MFYPMSEEMKGTKELKLYVYNTCHPWFPHFQHKLGIKTIKSLILNVKIFLKLNVKIFLNTLKHLGILQKCTIYSVPNLKLQLNSAV